MIATMDRKWNELPRTVHLMVFLTLLNIADFVLTNTLISVNGFEVEANPILLWLMYTTGTVYVILIAKMIPFSILWGLFVFSDRFNEVLHAPRFKFAIWFLTLAYSAVVIWGALNVALTVTLL